MSFRKSTIIETAQKLAAKGQFDKAILEWEKLIAEAPNDGNIYNSIGDLHLKAGQKKKATEVFINAADAFQSAGFEMKSIAVYKKALKVDPSRVEIHEKLAHVYSERGLIGNAIDNYLKAAKHYLQQNDFHASLTVYRKIADLDPSNSDILIEIGEMCQKQGHKEEAIAEYAKAVKLFEETDRASEAQAIISKIEELDPNYSKKGPASILEAAQKPEADLLDADDLFMPNAIDESPLTPEDTEMSGLLEPEPELMTNEQTVYSSELSLQAEDKAELSVGEETQNAGIDKPIESYLTEAEVYTQYGLTDKAIDQLRDAAERFPTEVQPQLKLKELYAQEGQTDKVAEICSTLAGLYKDNGDDAKRESILDELMAIQAQIKEGASASNKIESPAAAPTHDEAFLDPIEQEAFPDSKEDSLALIAGTEAISFDDEATLLAEPGNPKEKESAETSGAPSYLKEVNEPASAQRDVISEAKLGSDVNEMDNFFLDEEELAQEENAAPNLSTPQEVPPLNKVEQDIQKGDINLEDFALDSEALSASFDEQNRTSADPAPVGNTPEEWPSDRFLSEEALAETPLQSTTHNHKDEAEDYIDLQAIISEDLEEEENETTLERTIRSLQGKAQEDHDAQEIETQYDLGIAYKEMDMIHEAISAFEIAAQGEHRFKDAMTMLVICHRRNGSIDAAINLLQEGINNRKMNSETLITLKYELALLHDQQGNKIEAAVLFDEIFAFDPNFREVASKRSALVKDDLNSPWHDSPDKELSKGSTGQKKKDRVSYL